ncbi:hypothetical protein HY633_05030 [Candidatus Uhrbacteria bacterium]|nr:hypothetical protein [Candidatus Uhrbacteria bacterium]
MPKSRTPRQLLTSIGKKLDRAATAVEAEVRALMSRRNKIIKAAMARSDSKKLEDLRSSLGGKK